MRHVANKIPHLFVLFLVSSTSRNQYANAQRDDTCYVCRQSGRHVTNTDHAFTMPNEHGVKEDWTCGEIEDYARENLVTSHTVCGLATWAADEECSCNGPPIEPEPIIDNSPACNICKDDRTVPPELYDDMVETGVAGQMPCGFIYETSANGFLPAMYCETVQENVADFCCNPPKNDDEEEPQDEPTCGDLYAGCDSDTPCCDPYDCKVRVIGEAPLCSMRSVRKRQSIAGSNRGGAAARAKDAN